jgi:hypothetical protein
MQGSVSQEKRELVVGASSQAKVQGSTLPNFPLYLASKLSTPRAKGEGLILHPRLVYCEL